MERRKPKAERKTLMVPIRMTADQKENLVQKAKRRGLGLSTWLLILGLSAPDDPKPDA